MQSVLHFMVHWPKNKVLALTNRSRVLMLVGVVWTLWACSPTVYVEPATSMSLLQTVETDSMIGARVDAHNIAAMVRGDAPKKGGGYIEPMRSPEAYTEDGTEGVRSHQYHLGYAATRLIRAYYAESYPNGLRIESDKFVDIADAAGGYTDDIYKPNRDWSIEIADISRRVVFEIVPPGKTHQAYGQRKADLHAMLLNGTLFKKPQFKLGTGFSGEMGVRFQENAAPWKLSWSTTQPGVVQYHWQAMTVAKVTEESCRRAYLDKQWHDVTPREMALHGRSLHAVVEKLVQAREKLGPTRAAIKMAVVPGKSLFDYLDTVAKWSAHDEQLAQLLPVMYGPPVEVVPKKQFVAQTEIEVVADVGGLYDLKGRPGEQPYVLHMGISAHTLIGNYYKLKNPGDKVYTNSTSITTMVDRVGGTPSLLLPNEALLRPDIADFPSQAIFEIKSSAPGRLLEAQTTVNRNRAAINRTVPVKQQLKLGTNFGHAFWVRFNRNMPWWHLSWSTTAPGVVQYNWKKLNDSEVDERKIEDGVISGKYLWVDLTDEDMKQYGQEAMLFAKMYADGSQNLYRIRMVSQVLVELVGHASVVYLSPGLAANANAAAKAAVRATPPTQSGVNVHSGKVRVVVEPKPATQAPKTTRPAQAADAEPLSEPEFEPNVANRMRS